jgi:alpha-beta hydrolase superfamily lysophospholipase
MYPVLLLVLCALLLVFFTGGYTFFAACRRKKERNWLDKEAFEQTPYGQYHYAVVATDKWLKEHNVQDIYIRNRDNMKLHGLWIPAENPKGTVILAHGYCSSYLLDFAVVFDVYHKLGFHILVPEQRSHGQSEGKYITFGVKESDDMQDWLAYHNASWGELPLFFHGMSMGASTVLYLADEDLPDNVCGIIADCGFTSPKDIIKRVYKELIHLPAGPAIWAADIFARIFAGFSLNQKDTRKSLQNCKVPVLMIHGMADDFVPCVMTRQGYAACRSEKQLLLVAEATHGISFLKDPIGYTSAIFYFLKRQIKQLEY